MMMNAAFDYVGADKSEPITFAQFMTILVYSAIKEHEVNRGGGGCIEGE